MNRPVVIFSHGQESGPWGSKIRAMATLARGLGCETDSIDYQGIADPAERVEKLVASCATVDGDIVLVGSSMGGHVATAAASSVAAVGLFVLAPAYYMPGYEELTPDPPDIAIEIVHGWNDEIVPPENSIRFAGACSATLHLIDGGHRLTKNIDQINFYLERFINRIASPVSSREQK
jgi:predicted esterase